MFDMDESIYGAETNPVDSKLDLARAYLDMGDEDGARPVLMEVIKEGDLAQQAEARELFCGWRHPDSLRLSNLPLSPGARVAARIEYHGGHYHGWQAQPHLTVPTVQEALGGVPSGDRRRICEDNLRWSNRHRGSWFCTGGAF